MTSATEANTACERYERLDRKRAEGEALSSDERRFLEEHPQSCGECAAVELVTAAIRFSDGEPPCEPLDELSRRRIVNGALQQLDEAAASVEAAPEAPLPASAPEGSGRGRRRVASLAAGIAVVASAVLLWNQWRRPGTPTPGRSARAAETSVAQILLLSGAVRTDRGAASLHQQLGRGQWIDTGPHGRAVLHLQGGATVLLGSNTGLRLRYEAGHPVRLRLDRGELLSVVDAQRPGARFVVSTREGQVAVKGTIFTVNAGPGESRAAVLRGRVEVRGAGRQTLELTGGERVMVGTLRAEPLPAAESKRLWSQVRLLDLLTGDRPARFSVTSKPRGAEVSIDGVVLGRTPLAVALRAGHRRLELTRTGYGAVREHVLLRPDTSAARDFDLKPIAASPTATHATAVVPPAQRNHQPVKQRAQDLRRALLSQAQIRRAARDWHGSARAYAELIHRHPGSAEAATALVSLGVLQLRHLGRPTEALRQFDRYLARSRRGPLAREAAYGRIQALRALGRRAAERNALQRFLTDYPRALRAPKVRRRLRELGRRTPPSRVVPRGGVTQ